MNMNINFNTHLILYYYDIGGFGFVYLVEEETTCQLFALKHMIMQTKEARDAATREIELHVHIPFVFDFQISNQFSNQVKN